MAVLELQNLTTHYYLGANPVRAVENVSLNIDRQETLGLAGESGCGKTTTAYSILRILPENGKIVGIVGNTVDISYLKEIEAKLKSVKEQAEIANRLKSQFITNMEHDIRTPCSGIAQMATLLKAKEKDPEKNELLGIAALDLA